MKQKVKEVLTSREEFITSKEVFAKRREGALDEAYRMALQLMNSQEKNDWDLKAFSWCLIDLIKREASSTNQQNLEHYRQQLEAIKLDPNDDVLQKGVRYALSLCNPHGQSIREAKSLSKEGKHAEAANLYRKLCAEGVADTEIQTSLAWELYKLSKELMTQESVNLNVVKKNLNDYLKLEVEKPSLLHTCFLQLASKMAGQDKFNMLIFSRLWNLDYLRPEDFDRYVSDDGKEYPSLAEKVIQQAGKEAANSENLENLNYILPHIDQASSLFSDNIWLKLNKAKVLLALGKSGAALTFGLEVTKSKVNDYWAWELLGDILLGSDLNVTMCCYCKALLCSSDDKFTGKLRLKLATRLIDKGQLARAKYEVERVVAYRNKEGQKIPDDASEIILQSWYLETEAAGSNIEFYKTRVDVAEELLFSEMPWISANVGETFTVPGKEGKPKRKIFVKSKLFPYEVAIPESKFQYGGMMPGEAIRIKGEFDSNKRFVVYVIEKRDSDNKWDIFSDKVGVIDHVNREKKLFHFIINKSLDGIIPFTRLTGTYREGDAIAVKLSSYSTKQGERFRVLHVEATDQVPDKALRKLFCECVRKDNGMGFTSSDIFIPPPLMSKLGVEDGDKVSGVALLNYNKKRSSWGWKAVSIEDKDQI